MLRRPDVAEYPAYFQKYVEKVPDGDLIEYLEMQRTYLVNFINKLTPEQMSHKYAEDKWTVQQVLSHMNDVERVFGYRTLACLRNDTAELPGFEQDEYVEKTNMSKKTKENLAEEFEALRNANIHLFASADDSEWERSCKISGNVTTARSIVFMIAGHIEHHNRLFAEKYFK